MLFVGDRIVESPRYIEMNDVVFVIITESRWYRMDVGMLFAFIYICFCDNYDFFSGNYLVVLFESICYFIELFFVKGSAVINTLLV